MSNQHANTDPVRIFALAFVMTLAAWVSGCGPMGASKKSPKLRFLTLQAVSSGNSTRRLDVRADVSNPTSEDLKGVYLEVSLIDGPLLTLELGDIAAYREGTAWLPAKLVRGVSGEAMLGGATAIPGPSPAMKTIYLLNSVEQVHLGYAIGPEKSFENVTEWVKEKLPHWNQDEAKRIRSSD